MTGTSHLFHEQENGVHVAIDPYLLHVLKISRRFPFFPELLSATTPEMSNAGFHGLFKGFPIHIGTHQNLPANPVLNYGKDQTVFIF